MLIHSSTGLGEGAGADGGNSESARGFLEPWSAAGLEEAHSPVRMAFIAEFISGFFNALEGIEQAVKNVFQPGEIRYSYCVTGAHRNDSGTPRSLSR